MDFQDVKRRVKNIFREEPTTLSRLVLCKLITAVRCFLYTLKYRGLRRLGRERISEFRKTRARKVFVFANGPSLADLDFRKIKCLVESGEYDLITVNSFASKVMFDHDLKPSFGVFVDPSHYREKDDPKYSKQSELDIQAMNDKSVDVLVPYQYYHRTKFLNSIPCCMCSNVYSSNVSDVNKPIGFYDRTAFYSISLAMDIGYDEIYLCGYDNSYFKTYYVDVDNKQYFKNEHFYNKEASDFYLPREKYGPTTHIFFDIYKHFAYLEKINKLSTSKIYNIAKSTYTDAFDRNLDLDVYEK
ncbi:6-hydroxymethylpterin diphosphokinase MptE-like protein [Rubritalea sp.]|uniref:6-hydroxymethylpterin diphosphokinase MptE-like protein n=1 Tax=Rubritalea sp. TaxID=2109375 RepID=UPI003EF3E412